MRSKLIFKLEERVGRGRFMRGARVHYAMGPLSKPNLKKGFGKLNLQKKDLHVD